MSRVVVDELFAIIPAGILTHPDLSAQDVRVYAVLSLLGYTGERLSIADIGRRCGGASEATVRRSIKALADPAIDVVRPVRNTDGSGRQVTNLYEVSASLVTRAPVTGDTLPPVTGDTPSSNRFRHKDPPTEDRAGVAHARKTRPRDPLFDLLQKEVEGIPLGQTLGEREGSKIGTAAAEIRRAFPNNSVGAVMEAMRNWRSHFGQATMTAHGIAQWIGRLQRPAQGQAQDLPPDASEVQT